MKLNELGLLLPVPNAHDTKYSRGTVGFITGSHAYPGAALLGVAGAQGTSPGFVRYVGPRRVADLLLLTHPEVVVADDFASSGPAQAWVVGSGIGFKPDPQHAQIRAALERVEVAVVDAGALDLIGQVPLPAAAHHILTPHQGELCRLLNRLNGQTGLGESGGRFRHPEQLDNPDAALEAAIEAAELTGQTVLLKGSMTIVAATNGESVTVGPNSPWLATAGTGDVLAGIIGGIAAQNPEIVAKNWLDIARLAIELHSLAAEVAAETGPVTASAVASGVFQAISRKFPR